VDPVKGLKETVLHHLGRAPGLTDRELTNRIKGPSAPQQPINQLARSLEEKGIVSRRRRADGLIGNYLSTDESIKLAPVRPTRPTHDVATSALTEDELKTHLKKWLEADGWEVTIAWGRKPGVDIKATKTDRCWLIEAKGCGSLNAMRVNYFIGILGELLQRMTDDQASYAIALPDMPQFRGLWNRLPSLAKKRTGITALFVSANGQVQRIE